MMSQFYYFVKVSVVLSLVISCTHLSKNKKELFEQQKALSQVTKVDSAQINDGHFEDVLKQVQGNEEMRRFLSTDLFLKANMYLMNDEYEKSSQLFQYLNLIQPNNEFIEKKLVITLIKMGDIEQATPLLEKIYKKTNEPKMGLILAGLYSSQDQETKAVQIYEKILKKNPKDEDACIFLGKSLAIDKKINKAFLTLNKCSRLNPESGIYDFYIGKIHIDNGNLPKAIDSLLTSIRKQPDLSQAVAALGAIYEEREQFDLAIKGYKKFLEKKENDQLILSRIIQVLFVQEKFEEVIPYAERLSDLEPENLNLKVKLGVLYTDSGKFKEAINIFKELLTHAPNSDKILYYLGAIYQEMGELQSAIDFFNQVPVSSPLNADSSIQIANMLSNLAIADNEYSSIFLTHINKSIENHGELRVEFSVIKSGYYEAIGKNKEAMESLMVVQNEKGFTNHHKYYLANLYEKEKKYQESTDLIMSIVDKEPSNAHAWNFLGYAILERDGAELEKAYSFIQKAVELNPDDGYIRDSLGWYFYKIGRLDKALKEIEFAYKKVSDDVEILKHLAQIHKELKNFKLAHKFLSSAFKLAKLPDDKKKISIALDELQNLRIPASSEIGK